MEIIAPYTRWIRTFGCSRGLENAGSIAHSLGLKAAIGAWLSEDLVSNERQLSNLITMANAGDVDIAIVGGEVLLRQDLTVNDLILYIERVKIEAPGVPVTTSDGFRNIITNEDLMHSCDVIMVNYYPFWEGIHIKDAVHTLNRWHREVIAAAGDKAIIVAETGWPTAGDKIGDAKPSSRNAAIYLRDFVAWALANGVKFYYFEAFDEPWKRRIEGKVGANWGLWSEKGKMKRGLKNVFQGFNLE